MHGKGEFSKIEGIIYKITIEAANIWNSLHRLSVFNGLIIVKLKQDLKQGGHAYFEPVRPHIIYQPLGYFKSHTH